MQVINGTEFTQNEILVGQSFVTRSFGVTDDPMLMSMLSTGFYQHPLRTMIQEIMFNAWDAHRMANCQDKPIDIYINDTTGLIVRDYGPGIEPGENDNNMHQIYCMYGGSTKRNLKNQTGGFGLGSKSPFAYTESFTVTSHFGGTKNMYLISRVSEANEGKPGMTCLVRVPTTETGLMVTVPLKKDSEFRAYDLVKDVLFLSGIKANIHYMDDPVELIESESVTPGAYHVEKTRTGRNIYAVYGGVRYLIPENPEYKDEYSFLRLLANNKNIYVGFAPDSLSPLPNREGLNMGEKSKETVKAVFERCTEKFQETFNPLIKLFFQTLFEKHKKEGVQGHFAFYNAYDIAFTNSYNDLIDLKLKLIENKPSNIDLNVWKIAVELILVKTGAITNYVGFDSWKVIFAHAFIETFPDHKNLAFKLLKEPIFKTGIRKLALNFVANIYNTRFLIDQMTFIKKMKEAFPNDDTLIPVLHFPIGNKYTTVIQERSKSNKQKTKWGVGTLEADDPRLKRKDGLVDLNAVYHKTDSTKLNFMMMQKTIIIAKTISTLNSTHIPEKFRNNKKTMNSVYEYQNDTSCVLPGYVVHKRQGAYEKALEILTHMGFIVIEGDEPVKAVVKPKKASSTFNKLAIEFADWKSSELIDNPTHFLYLTTHMIHGCSYLKPAPSLVAWFTKIHPKTVLVGYKKSADKLHTKGVIPFHEEIENWFIQLSTDEERMRNLIRGQIIRKKSNLSDEMIFHPLIQLELGMEPIDPNDLNFWADSEALKVIKSSECFSYNFNEKVKKRIEHLWDTDPEKQNIVKMCNSLQMFTSYALSSLWSSAGSDDKDKVVDKIIAAMKLFS
jgi:hypothetical protein